jgi:hypothetical protein
MFVNNIKSVKKWGRGGGEGGGNVFSFYFFNNFFVSFLTVERRNKINK